MNYDNNNIFAKILRKELPAEIVYEDQSTIAIMDIMPRTDGHLLILPKSPCRNILDVTDEQLSACAITVKKLANIAMKAFNADGVTVQQFNETAGGQEVFHLHFHILPRMNGVDLRRHDGKIEDSAILKENADKIRAVVAI